MLSQLLEDHLQKLREEDGVSLAGSEDEWDGWDVDSDSDSDSDSDDWINVDDDDKDLEISDSEDEKDDKKDETGEAQASNSARISTLATTKVCSNS